MKKLYIADCLVTMASSTPESDKQYDLYEKTATAIKEMK